MCTDKIYITTLICLPVVMSVCREEYQDQQPKKIRVIVPQAFVSQKYIPIRECVYGTTNSVVETNEYTEHACKPRVIE